jgi:hypothetical protein
MADEKIAGIKKKCPGQYSRILDSADPFKDNSGVLCYPFNGDASDTGGKYPGQIKGNVNFIPVPHVKRQAAQFDGETGTGIRIWGK